MMKSNVALCYVQVLLASILLIACGGGEDASPVNNVTSYAVTINQASTQQEMVGFGGALTWYSPWVTNNMKKNEIADLMFDDLGIDIIRFKNWYYPNNYPTVKSTDAMDDDGSLSHWNATNELYTMAMDRNDNIKILLSSWGPPASLKSNNSTRETTGSNTLKKKDGQFMYDELAQYYYDMLEYMPFDPDYLSIQNEPTYSNTGWTTCKWAATETSELPGYVTAFDKVYDAIKDRTHVPVMLGPESQDIPTYAAFANLLKDKAHCGMLGYHPYNVNSGTTTSSYITELKSIGAINVKPNLMTEFSDNLDWFKTANFIQNSLIHANSSGYIYWKLAWATPASGEDRAMISTANNSSTYKVTPYYHLIKHFSKNIDAGYHRVDATSVNANIAVSAFLNPAGTQLTVILINNSAGKIEVDLKATGKTISAISATQSKVGTYYVPVPDLSPEKSVALAAQSITTVVLDI